MKIVAREMAMEFTATTLMPQLGRHIPGVTNGLADYLSRCHQPDHPACTGELPFPSALIHAMEVHPPVRDSSWYTVPIARMARRREH